MPLETVTYTSDLVTTNPDHNDSLGVVDSHVRNLKSAIRNTFPNITGPVTLTQAQINALSTAIARIVTLEGQANHLTGDQTLAANFTATGYVNAASIKQGGVTLLPAGCVILWSGDPAAIPAGWVLCDGRFGTPDLRDRFVVGSGLSYGQWATGGNGFLTNVPTNVAGGHSHGGITEPAGAHNHTGVTSINGDHSHTGVTGGHVLTVDEIPPHAHSFAMFAGAEVTGDGTGNWVTGPGVQGITTSNTGSGWGHSHPIVTDGAHFHTLNTFGVDNHGHGIDWDAGHQHVFTVDARPAYYALAYIMKAS